MTLQRPSATRWLSYQQSVDSVKRSYRALLQHLAEKVDVKKDSKAAGILKKARKLKFVLTLEMMSNILMVDAAI